jgi:mono/diheme cytochrome c family protein
VPAAWLLLALVLPGLPLLAGCGDRPPSGSAPVTGEQVFSQNCVGCHGAQGQGVPGAGPPLGRAATGAEAALRQLIRNGKGRMPAFKSLSDRQVDAVIAHLRQVTAGAVTGGPHGRP